MTEKERKKMFNTSELDETTRLMYLQSLERNEQLRAENNLKDKQIKILEKRIRLLEEMIDRETNKILCEVMNG